MKQVIAVIALLSLAGCGGSRWNPLNWFSGDRSEPVAATAVAADPTLSDPRPLVVEVTSLAVERSSGGAIVRATGLAPGPGYWGGELVPLADETPVNGVLVYLFRIEAPETPKVLGPRQLTAARFVDEGALSLARGIVVRGAQNQRSAGR